MEANKSWGAMAVASGSAIQKKKHRTFVAGMMQRGLKGYATGENQVVAWNRAHSTVVELMDREPVPVRAKIFSFPHPSCLSVGIFANADTKTACTQPHHLTAEGHSSNIDQLKDIICKRMGIAAAPGAIPIKEWDEVLASPKLTYLFLRAYTFHISYAQAHVRASPPFASS